MLWISGSISTSVHCAGELSTSGSEITWVISSSEAVTAFGGSFSTGSSSLESSADEEDS